MSLKGVSKKSIEKSAKGDCFRKVGHTYSKHGVIE